MPDSVTLAAGTLELSFAGAGLVLWWRRLRLARQPLPDALPAWPGTAADFLRFILYVMAGTLGVGAAVSLATKSLQLGVDAATVINGGASQFGMLAGVLIYRATYERSPSPASAPRPSIVASGAATFLMALPVLMITAQLWELVLRAAGLPAQKQDLIDMFARAESPWLLAALIGFAVVVAPVTEELIFRAGLFRFLRLRVPASAAYLLPAVFFAALHVNWATLDGIASFAPLVVLALLFSRAYAHTGQIGTPIVAHALFNLNTVFLIFTGLGS